MARRKRGRHGLGLLAIAELIASLLGYDYEMGYAGAACSKSLIVNSLAIYDKGMFIP